MVNLQESFRELREILRSQIEWLLIHSNGASFALQNIEIELEVKQEKLLLSFLGDKGFQTWRITDWKHKNERIALDLTRNFGREKVKIELVPRVSSDKFNETVELARIEKAGRIADLIVTQREKSKLIRVELNKDNGRFAQIIFEEFSGNQYAVLADISDSLTPEILLCSAILWLRKLRNRKKKPIETIRILAENKTAKSLQKIHALLREDWKRKIKIGEICDSESKEKTELKELSALDFEFLFKNKTKKASSFENEKFSETALKIIQISPREIDALQNKNGETLYYSGLPFVRIRKVLNEEKVWFGVESNRRFLSENNLEEFAKLIDELQIYRRFDSQNKHHLFYKSSPEAWLESILRKNIKKLDANLILSPLYNQFRAGQDKIDLLAIRRDGRLVIIEVKTSVDREIIFQAADYWRKIETERRAGDLQKSEIFGDLKIKDEPALVYLVAPLLSFHKDFDFLAQTISPEIEIYRFAVNENWRESLKVIRRQ